jgi:hypothetical protein
VSGESCNTEARLDHYALDIQYEEEAYLCERTLRRLRVRGMKKETYLTMRRALGLNIRRVAALKAAVLES